MIVMMLCHYNAELPMGGLTKQAGLLSRTLMEAGEDVVILSSTRVPSRAHEQTLKGVRTRLFWTYASPQRAGLHMPAALFWAAQLLIWIAVRRKHIRVLHVHEIRIHAFVAALARKWFGIPTVMKSALGGEKADLKVIGSRRFWGAGGRAFVIRNADCFVATTSTIAEDLALWGAPAARTKVIPNGAEMPPAEPVRPDAERARRFVYLGRLHDGDKNILAMAEAFIRVADGRELTLDVYGSGPDEPRLQALIERSGSRAVVLKGWAEKPRDVLPRYGHLLLPSHREGLSNAMIEAMACGVVPVVTNVSGAADHIRSGENGWLIASPAVADIERALTLAAEKTSEEWAAMADGAGRYARETFGIDTVAARYRELYASLRPIRGVAHGARASSEPAG
jgi:glycosyltransferase involved in cell wall biosynthesis